MVMPSAAKMRSPCQPETISLGKHPASKAGRVRINREQYFDMVPETAWNFPIGGYLPAQRWLTDRIGRKLTFEDKAEYGRIVWALNETRRLMAEIDASIVAHGGWPLE